MSNGVKYSIVGAMVFIMVCMFAVNAIDNKKSSETASEQIYASHTPDKEPDGIPSETRAGYIIRLMSLYEKITGGRVDINGEKPMFMDSHEGIVKAWKIGIIDEGDTAFYYSGSGIQYQTAAQLLYRAIVRAESDFAIDDNEARYVLNNCYDNIGIEEKNLQGCAFLYKYGIADKKLSPEAFMTDKDINNLINAAERIFAQNKEIEIAGKKIKTGMSRTKLIRTLGNPCRIEKNDKNEDFSRYVYNSNYAEFIMVDVYNEVVTGFFTNCRDFKFGDIQSGSMYADVKDDSVKYYLDSEKKVDGISCSTIEKDNINIEYAGEDITDIINAVRIKKGGGELYYQAEGNNGEYSQIAEIKGADISECYKTLIASGYNTPFEYAASSKGYICAEVSELAGDINIILKAREDKAAAREINRIMPEKNYYKAVNKELSNIAAPAIISPAENSVVYGDVEVSVDLGDSDFYRIVAADNETLEIVVNSYIAHKDKITLPAYLFSDGGDYTLSVYTPDGEKSNLVEFAYGDAKPPVIISPSNTVYGNTLDIMWNSGGYSESLIEIFDSKSNLLASLRVSGENETQVSGIYKGSYLLRVSSLKKNTNTVKSYTELNFEVKDKDADIIYDIPAPVSPSGSTVKFKSDKYARIFGQGRGVYTSKKEADENIVKITVPVWKLQDGRKISSSEDIMINKALAQEVYDIFYEIYLGSERFPIKSVGAYSWRSTATGTRSQHSYGTAIDINANENYCIYNSGRKIGSYWKPNEDPYSIPENGDVVRAFKSRGWTWGAEWNSLKDYMHFSYLGG